MIGCSWVRSSCQLPAQVNKVLNDLLKTTIHLLFLGDFYSFTWFKSNFVGFICQKYDNILVTNHELACVYLYLRVPDTGSFWKMKIMHICSLQEVIFVLELLWFTLTKHHRCNPHKVSDWMTQAAGDLEPFLFVYLLLLYYILIMSFYILRGEELQHSTGWWRQQKHLFYIAPFYVYTIFYIDGYRHEPQENRAQNNLIVLRALAKV